MPERIGIVTGGGDCPGLNAVIRAVVKAAAHRGWESIGFLGGYEGMLEPLSYRPLDYTQMGGLLFRGGTILGTSNKGRFAAKMGHGEVRRVPEEILGEAKRNFDALGLRALVCIGGDGSLTIAQQLYETGVPVVGVPKTIDNDLDATLMTFGFDSAVACAVDALDRLHTTAESHNRVMVLEVMGRYAGWIAVSAGLAGGADVILIPEIPFNYDSIVAKIREREAQGKHFTIVIVAEGARLDGGEFVTAGEAGATARRGWAGSVRWWRGSLRRAPARNAARWCWAICSAAARPPPGIATCARAFGVSAVELIAAEQYGYMVASDGNGHRAGPALPTPSTGFARFRRTASWCARPARWGPVSATNKLIRIWIRRDAGYRPHVGNSWFVGTACAGDELVVHVCYYVSSGGRVSCLRFTMKQPTRFTAHWTKRSFSS